MSRVERPTRQTDAVDERFDAAGRMFGIVERRADLVDRRAGRIIGNVVGRLRHVPQIGAGRCEAILQLPEHVGDLCGLIVAFSAPKQPLM